MQSSGFAAAGFDLTQRDRNLALGKLMKLRGIPHAGSERLCALQQLDDPGGWGELLTKAAMDAHPKTIPLLFP
jgi:hypothetical protein